MAKTKNPERQKCWDEFAHYVRLKGCLETTGMAFVGICITCDVQYHITYLAAGHYVPGRRNSVLLTKKFIDIQCRKCNEIYNGQSKKYRKVLIKRHGKDFVDRWKKRLLAKIIPDKAIKWSARRERYKRKTQKLLEGDGYRTFKEVTSDRI